MSKHEFLPGTNTLSPAGIESLRAEIKEVSRQFDLHYMQDEAVKDVELSLEPSFQETASFIEGDAIFPLPIMPMRKTLGQLCGMKSSAILESILAALEKNEQS